VIPWPFRMSASIADEAGWVANTGIGMDPSNNYESVGTKGSDRLGG
jgi:hypothetical protein